MSLTQVEVFSPRIPVSLFPYAEGSADTDPIQIRKIDGLGPVPASANIESYGSADGGWGTGAYVGSRNIVITVGLHPDWATQTYESLRSLLYAYFMPKQSVRLRISSTHLPTVEISGIVETFEPDIFSNDPEYQISIVCAYPYFVDVQETVLSGTTLAIGATSNVVIQYDGTADSGFVVTLEKGSGPDQNGSVQIVNENPLLEVLAANSVIINATTYFEASTVQADKYTRRVVGGVKTNWMGYTPQNVIWTHLKPGVNNMRFLTPAAGSTWTLRYRKRFGGL